MGFFRNICNKISGCTEVEPQHRMPSYISGFLGGGAAIGLYEWGLWAAGLYASTSNLGVVMLKVMAVLGGAPVGALAGAASIGLTNCVLKSCCSSTQAVDTTALLGDVRKEETKAVEGDLKTTSAHKLRAVVVDGTAPKPTVTGYQSLIEQTGGYHSGEEEETGHKGDLAKKKQKLHHFG